MSAAAGGPPAAADSFDLHLEREREREREIKLIGKEEKGGGDSH